MQKIILSITIVLGASALLYSCGKETIASVVVTPPPPSPMPDTLSGNVIVFDALTWQLYNSGSPGWDEIYLTVPSTHELNQNATAKAEVFLKYDTSSNWIKVVRYSEAQPYHHIFFFNSQNLIIEEYPLNYQLPGRKASVKVKFQ